MTGSFLGKTDKNQKRLDRLTIMQYNALPERKNVHTMRKNVEKQTFNPGKSTNVYTADVTSA